MKYEKRLVILTDTEIEDLYGLPHFTEEQRRWHFSLNNEELKAIQAIKTISVKIHFILELGYFKAKSMFFSFDFQEGVLCPTPDKVGSICISFHINELQKHCDKTNISNNRNEAVLIPNYFD